MNSQQTHNSNISKHRSTIDSFQFIKKLGQGAYSSVFKAKRKIDGQYYALKKVNMKALSYKQKQNSLNQVRILASIKNRNIIQYKQAFFQGDTLFVIMQYADNGDLYAQISRRRKNMQFYNQQQIWSIFLQICSGLKAMHQLNVIHRDLKSANVFLNKNGQIKLGDMNVSKVGSLCLTQTGTPYYASPQVWKDIPYDAKSDIWSLGCVLYQLTTLFPPFRGADMEQLYNKVVKGGYEKIPQRYSENLALMIAKVLQKSPMKRPSSQLIVRNIKKIVPQEFQEHPIIKQLIQDEQMQQVYIKQNIQHSLTNNNTNSSGNGSTTNSKNFKKELLKTINFPTKKQKKKSALILSTGSPNQNKHILQSLSIHNGNNNIAKNHQSYHHSQNFSLSNLLPLPSYHTNKSKNTSLSNSKISGADAQKSKEKRKISNVNEESNKNKHNNNYSLHTNIQANSEKEKGNNYKNIEKKFLKRKNSIDKKVSLKYLQNKENHPISLCLPSVNIQMNGDNNHQHIIHNSHHHNQIIEHSNQGSQQQMKKRINAKMVEMQKYRKGNHQKLYRKSNNSFSNKNILNELKKQQKMAHGNVNLKNRPSKRNSKSSINQLDAILQKQKSKRSQKQNNQNIHHNQNHQKLKEKQKQKDDEKLVLPSIQKKPCHQQLPRLIR